MRIRRGISTKPRTTRTWKGKSGPSFGAPSWSTDASCFTSISRAHSRATSKASPFQGDAEELGGEVEAIESYAFEVEVSGDLYWDSELGFASSMDLETEIEMTLETEQTMTFGGERGRVDQRPALPRSVTTRIHPRRRGLRPTCPAPPRARADSRVPPPPDWLSPPASYGSSWRACDGATPSSSSGRKAGCCSTSNV